MSRIISGKDLQAKLLARKDRAVPSKDAWMDVLGAPGHRELLSIIAKQRPQSIGELSKVAGRAQPNVSRSLSALMRTDLVSVVSSGRVSIPSLTEFGFQKATEFGLLSDTEAPAVEGSGNGAEVVIQRVAPYLFVSPDAEIEGGVGRLCINAPIHRQIVVGTDSEDLRAASHRLFDHWWRMWYRRDAPFKIGMFSFDGREELTLLLRSNGTRIDRILRPRPGSQLQLTRDTIDCSTFEHELLNSVLRPVVAACSKNGAQFDELLASKLSRLVDSYAEPAERAFCRTAGALNLPAYDLTDELAEQVRELVASMPDEDARLDFASVMLVGEIAAVSNQIEASIKQSSGRNTLTGVPGFVAALQPQISGLAGGGLKPWQKGTTAAKAFRAHLNFSADAAIGSATKLAHLCGAEDFPFHDLGTNELLAFQAEVNDAPAVLVQEGGARGAAFVLARAVGDYLVFQSKKSCVANKYTDRQAVGRAFAAEFMAPADGVVSMIDEEERSVTQVAAHYGVPLEVVEHQYLNNYLV